MSREYLVVPVLSAALAPSAASACESAGPATAIDAVRARRAAFNEALAKQDIEAAAATIRAGVVLVAGTTNEVISGRAAQPSLWRGNFSTSGRGVFVRTADCVRVSEVVPVAFETGRWRPVLPALLGAATLRVRRRLGGLPWRGSHSAGAGRAHPESHHSTRGLSRRTNPGIQTLSDRGWGHCERGT